MTATRFLRFPSAAEFLAGLPPGFALQGETGGPLPGGVQALRVLPFPLMRGGRWGADGKLLDQPVEVPGFHVNVLGDLPAAWAPFEVFPSAPMGVFGEVAHG